MKGEAGKLRSKEVEKMKSLRLKAESSMVIKQVSVFSTSTPLHSYETGWRMRPPAHRGLRLRPGGKSASGPEGP